MIDGAILLQGTETPAALVLHPVPAQTVQCSEVAPRGAASIQIVTVSF